MALQPIKAQRIGIPETTPPSRYPLGLHAERAISNIRFNIRVRFDNVGTIDLGKIQLQAQGCAASLQTPLILCLIHSQLHAHGKELRKPNSHVWSSGNKKKAHKTSVRLGVVFVVWRRMFAKGTLWQLDSGGGLTAPLIEILIVESSDRNSAGKVNPKRV